MPDYETLLKEMYEYFSRHGNDKGLSYAFGFFDAVSIIRGLQEGRKNE